MSAPDNQLSQQRPKSAPTQSHHKASSTTPKSGLPPQTAVGIRDEGKEVDIHGKGNTSILQSPPLVGHLDYTKGVPSTPASMHSPLMGSNGEILAGSGESAARSTKSKVSFTNLSGADNVSKPAPSPHPPKPKVGAPTDFQAFDDGQEMTSRVYTSENLKPQKKRWK